MLKQTLPNDVTIADLLNGLNKPGDYLQRVLANMWECKREFGTASVRIGVTGRGRAPNYRIEYARNPNEQPGVFAVYRGLGHKHFEDLGERGRISLSDDDAQRFATEAARRPAPAMPDRRLQDEQWSTRTMSLDEIGRLRADLQNRRR